MNLLGIRTQFVERTGRFDLVVDTTDYVDNGANFFIQAGQRLLDSILPNRKDVGRYHKVINANQSSITLKHIRAFDTVYIKASGSKRQPLDRKTYSWLLEQYGEDYGEKATGLITFSDIPTADETLVTDTETWTFKATASSTYEVTIGATVTATIDNLVAKINANSAVITAEKYSATEVLIEYYLVGTAGNAIAFTDTSSVITLDGSGVLGGSISGRANQIGTGQPTYWAPLISTPHPSLSLANITSDESHDLLFGLERFQKDGLLIMPPADASYTISIYAYFFSLMTSDADVSYHSEMYPELLLMASMLALEAFYRNTQGVKDWLSSMQLWLTGVDHDLVRAEMVQAGTQMRG